MVALSNRQQFDIRSHLDKLTPAKGKNHYICPVCEGDNMTIDPNTGEYQCWSGCECKDIREAVAPWASVSASRTEKVKGKNYQPIGSRKPILKPKPPLAAPIPQGEHSLAKLPNPVTRPEQRKRGNRTEIEYRYSENQWVLRVEKPNPQKPKGYQKDIYPYHIDETGCPKKGKGNAAWNPYRIDEVIAHATGKWVIGVEGESCVEAVRQMGLVAFTFQGSGWNHESLYQGTLQLKEAGIAGIYYCPDNDPTGYKKADALEKACAKAQLPFILTAPSTIWKECPHNGDIADWVNWTMEQGWDINQAREHLEKLFGTSVEHQLLMQEIEQEAWNDVDDDDDDPLLYKTNTKSGARYAMIERYWGHRLRLNELKNIIELDGEPLHLDTLYIDIALRIGIDVPKNEAIDICARIAKRNAYNPVRDYLNQCHQDHEPIDINNLATRWFGTTDPLANIYLKRYLIGAVARTYEPGCKNDISLILQGAQGTKKSTFFRVLHQGSGYLKPHQTWFDDTMLDVGQKDERDKLHRFWCLEWAELEKVIRKGDDIVKSFLATQHDTYRPPYGREPVTKARMSVIVGTTNREEFLSDDSGDRRYWAIKVEQEINMALVEAEREQVWAAAVAAYRAGEQWHLTKPEQQLSSLANSQFHTSDAWEVYIIDYLQGRSVTTTAQILEKALDFDKSRQDRASQMRVSSIMHRLGWKKGKVYVEDKRVNGWILPCDNTPPPDTPRPVQPVRPVQPNPIEVGQPSNEAASRLSDIAVQPVQPFSTNFSEKTENEFVASAMSSVEESLETEISGQVGQEEPEQLQLERYEAVQPTVQPIDEVVQVGQEVELEAVLTQTSNIVATQQQVTDSVEEQTDISAELLAMLICDAQNWAEVEVAIAVAPLLKKQVWALLSDEHKNRVRQMKQACEASEAGEAGEVGEAGGVEEECITPSAPEAPSVLKAPSAPSAPSALLSEDVPKVNLVGKRVYVTPGEYRKAGEGVIECDRGWNVVDIRMLSGLLQTGIMTGDYQVLE